APPGSSTSPPRRGAVWDAWRKWTARCCCSPATPAPSLTAPCCQWMAGIWSCRSEENTAMPTKLFDLSGRVALVSGASRGIGEAIAKLLAEQGAHVIVTSRRLEGCEQVAEAIRTAGGSAEAMACHIGELEQIEATFAKVKA